MSRCMFTTVCRVPDLKCFLVTRNVTYSEPLAWKMFGTDVVGRVQGPCCETYQGLMLWDVFYAHGVGHTDANRVESACLQQCAGPLI